MIIDVSPNRRPLSLSLSLPLVVSLVVVAIREQREEFSGVPRQLDGAQSLNHCELGRLFASQVRKSESQRNATPVCLLYLWFQVISFPYCYHETAAEALAARNNSNDRHCVY